MGDFEGDRQCVTHHACDCMKRKARERDELLSAFKQWRNATEQRLRLLDSRGEAAKAMLSPDRTFIEAVEGIQGGSE